MLALALGCAPRSGWTRTDARVCEPKGPPLLCFEADPDQPLELHVGGLVLLPGECAHGPRRRGGTLGVRLVDGRSTPARGRTQKVRVPRGRRTTLVVEEGEHRLKAEARDRCMRTL